MRSLPLDVHKENTRFSGGFFQTFGANGKNCSLCLFYLLISPIFYHHPYITKFAAKLLFKLKLSKKKSKQNNKSNKGEKHWPETATAGPSETSLLFMNL